MKERIVFGGTDAKPEFKIYSIIKRERGPRSLLARRPSLVPDFSWPPHPRRPLISDSARDKGDEN